MSSRGYLSGPRSKQEVIDEELNDIARNLACELNGLLGNPPYNLWRQDEARVLIFNALLKIKKEKKNG